MKNLIENISSIKLEILIQYNLYQAKLQKLISMKIIMFNDGLGEFY